MDVKKIIAGHAFILTKFCVWDGVGMDFVLNNKYDQLLSFNTLNWHFKMNCILYNTCHFTSILMTTYKR